MALYAFGEMLKAFRKRQHLTQKELARRVGVHLNTIGIWERGDFLPETRSVVLELGRYLHLGEQETRELLEASLTGLPPAWHVPYARNPFFTGRGEILGTLHQRLTGQKVVALTQSYALSGLGGIGKTQVAVEYSYRHSLEYSAILWIRAESAETIKSSFAAIAQCLQLPEREVTDQQQMVTAVQHWLSAHSQWLLIWDNVEDLGLVQRFFPVTRAGAILITTRRRALGTLAQSLELSQLSPSEGLLLLLRRSKVLSPEARLEQVEQFAQKMSTQYQAAEQLVALMDGLPLALDQAAAYIEETPCSLATYLELYQTRQAELLNRRGETVSEHPASVVATWSLSFERMEQVNPLATGLLRLCAFLHPDSIPEEILLQGVASLDEQAGAEEAFRFQLLEAMRTISIYSLLRPQVEERTYSMHRLVQAVLRASMDADLVQRWMERTIYVVHGVFPEVEYSAWGQCERLVPHALVCASYPVRCEQSRLELASLLFKAASYLGERAQYAEAEPLFQHVLQMREQALGEGHPDVARVLSGLADLSWRQGKYAEAEVLYDQALRILEQALGREHPDVARSLSGLAMLYWSQGRYEEAELLYEQALRLSEQALGGQHPDVARSLFGLGAVYSVQGKYARAEALYQRSLRICERTLGATHPNTVPVLHNLACLYFEQGKYEEAEPLADRVVFLWEKTLGPEHPHVSYGLDHLALIYQKQGKYEEAEALSRRSLSIREQALGSEHSNVADSFNNLAHLYLEQGKYEEAEPLFQRAVLLLEKTLGATHPNVAYGFAHLATLYRKQGKYEEAEALSRRSLSIREQALGSEHPDVADSLNNLALLYSAQGKYEEAEPLFHRALCLWEKTLGEAHPDVANLLHDLALLYIAQGKYKEAEPPCQRVLSIWEKALGEAHLHVSSMLETLATLYQKQGKSELVEPLYRCALSLRDQALEVDQPKKRPEE